MPKNRIIYWGIVVLVATVLVWIGAELTRRIAWLLPYAAVGGVGMIIGGFAYELWQQRKDKRASGPR